jgi:hypothetical protein
VSRSVEDGFSRAAGWQLSPHGAICCPPVRNSVHLGSCCADRRVGCSHFLEHHFQGHASERSRHALDSTSPTRSYGRHLRASYRTHSETSENLPHVWRPLKHGRSHCAACAGPESRKRMIEVARLGRVATHSPKAEALRAATRRRHAVALKSWQPSEHPRWLTEDLYLRKIQPQLKDLTVSSIALTLGISLLYATDIRAGRRRPHPRHWQALAEMVGLSSYGF